MADVASFDSDAMLGLLDELAKRADKLKTAVTGMGEGGSRHLRAASESASALDKQVVALSRNLLGPIGLAAGFVAVAKSLDNLAVGQLQLANLARNTGMAAGSVLRLQAQFERAGLSIGEANSIIQGFGSSLDSIKIFKEGSPVFGQIAQGAPKLAETVLNFEKMGDRMSSLAAIQKSYNAGTAEWKLYLEQVFHTNATGMKAMTDDLKGAVLLTQHSEEDMRKYHIQWINLRNTVTNIWDDVSISVLGALDKIGKGLEEQGITAESVSKGIKQFFEDNINVTIKQTASEIVAVISALNSAEKWLSDHGIGANKGDAGHLTKPLEPTRPEGSKNLTWDEWFKQKFPGFQRQNLKGNAETTMEFSAKGHTGLQDVEQDSNKLLHDIRDILQRSEVRGGEGGGGLTFRHGVGTGRASGGGSGGDDGLSLSGGGGGARTGGGGRRAGGGGGGDSVGTGAEGDTSLVGNEFLASQRSRIKKEIEDDPELRLRAAALTSLENEGAKTGVMESAMNRAIFTKRSLKSILSGGPNSFYGPARKPGLVEARMNSLRNNPQRFGRLDAFTNQALAGSNLIEGYTDQGSKGDPNYEKGGIGKNINRERFNDWGVAGSREFRLNQQEQVRKSAEAAAASRAYAGLSLDESQRGALNKSMGAAPNGHLTADVNFGNVPPGVRTNTEGTGFKMLRVTSSKQNQKAAEGMLAPGDMQYTPFVP